MRTKATLKNISQALNISISTVSRALKNHPDIADETKRKVMELATLMEYEPNTYAINLRTNRSRIFGLIVPEISYYFYDSFVASVEQEARKLDYGLLILQSGNDPAIELENLRICRINRVAGVFVSLSSGASDINTFLKMDEVDIPVVFVDKVPAYEACNKVSIADEEAAVLAASRILATEPKRVLALMGNENLSITRRREKAFADLFASRAPQVQLDIAHADNAAEARSKAREILESADRPDVLFCMSDEILTGAMKAVQKLKLKIPDDIGILSISNDGFIPNLFDPEITYVETSGHELGVLAFRRMMDLLEGKKSFVRELLQPAKLVPGHSI